MINDFTELAGGSFKHSLQPLFRGFALELNDGNRLTKVEREITCDERSVFRVVFARGIDPTKSGRVRPVRPNTLKNEWSTMRAALFRAPRTAGAKQGDRSNIYQTLPIAELMMASAGSWVQTEIHVFSPDELQANYAFESETQLM